MYKIVTVIVVQRIYLEEYLIILAVINDKIY